MKTKLHHERLEYRLALSAAPLVPAVLASSSVSNQTSHVYGPVQKNHAGVATIHNCLWKGTHLLGSATDGSTGQAAVLHRQSTSDQARLAPVPLQLRFSPRPIGPINPPIFIPQIPQQPINRCPPALYAAPMHFCFPQHPIGRPIIPPNPITQVAQHQPTTHHHPTTPPILLCLDFPQHPIGRPIIPPHPITQIAAK